MFYFCLQVMSDGRRIESVGDDAVVGSPVGDIHLAVVVDERDWGRVGQHDVVVDAGQQVHSDLHDPVDDSGVRIDIGRRPGGQLPRARRHLEQPRLAQFHQPLPAQLEPGRHPRTLRLHAHRPHRNDGARRSLDLWKVHV